MIIQAVKIISVDNPSTGMKLGHSLIAISQMYMYDSLMLEADTDSKRACYKKAKEFKLVMQSNWSVEQRDNCIHLQRTMLLLNQPLLMSK